MDVKERSFQEYECSLGTVIAHQENPPAYIIRTTIGVVTGILAKGELGPENVDIDIVNPAPISSSIHETFLSKNTSANKIDIIIASIPDEGEGSDIQYANKIIPHDHPLIIQLASAFGLTFVQIEKVFRIGSNIYLITK